VTLAASIGVAMDQIQTLDILVNNAGIGMVGDLASTSEEDFERVMRVNVHSVYLVTRAMLPLLLMSRGSIVNIGSGGGTDGREEEVCVLREQGCGDCNDAADCSGLSEAASLQLHRAGDGADAVCGRDISTSITRMRRNRCARSCGCGNRLEGWERRRILPGWYGTYAAKRRSLCRAPWCRSMVDGRRLRSSC